MALLQGLDSAGSGTGAFIMRYRDATTAGQAAQLCSELSGESVSRFQGQCLEAPVSPLHAASNRRERKAP